MTALSIMTRYGYQQHDQRSVLVGCVGEKRSFLSVNVVGASALSMALSAESATLSSAVCGAVSAVSAGVVWAVSRAGSNADHYH